MAMTPSPSPLQRVGPTCREWKRKRLQVGCNPSAINSTHTPVWLLNEWKLVSCLPLCWAPGPCVSARLLTGAAHVLDATFKMAPCICKRPLLRRERRTHTALICFDKLTPPPATLPAARVCIVTLSLLSQVARNPYACDRAALSKLAVPIIRKRQ